MLRRSGTDHLGEGREADPHQLAAGALLGLLLQQRLVADRLERLVERLVIVAAVVGESECGSVGELLFLHEVLPPQLHRVDAELVGKDVHRALDRVTGFGHAERAAIGDASRRLVREVGVHLGVRDGHVVAAGNDTEHAGWVLRRVGRGVEGTVIGVGRDAKRGELAVGGRTKLDVHVVVARKPRRRQVLRPGLDPLHRPAQLQRANDGTDIPRVHRDFVTETATQVGRHHVDLVLRDAGYDRDRRSVDMRRLGCHVELQATHGVEVRHASTGFERRGMAALKPHALTYSLRTAFERTRRPVPVPDLPMEDVVGLFLAIRPQDHFILLRRRRIGHDREGRVVDLHGLGAVHGGTPRFAKDRGDFLVLEEDLADRQHHLFVEPVECREPSEACGLEVLAGDHGLDPGNLHRLADVDRLDLGVRVGAPHECQVQHPRQGHVVDVVSLALEETRILLALHGDAEGVSGLGVDAHSFPLGHLPAAAG